MLFAPRQTRTQLSLEHCFDRLIWGKGATYEMTKSGFGVSSIGVMKPELASCNHSCCSLNWPYLSCCSQFYKLCFCVLMWLLQRLRDLSEDENNQKWLFVTEEDIKGLLCLQVRS